MGNQDRRRLGLCPGVDMSQVRDWMVADPCAIRRVLNHDEKEIAGAEFEIWCVGEE